MPHPTPLPATNPFCMRPIGPDAAGGPGDAGSSAADGVRAAADHHRAGRAAEAEAACWEVLDRTPGHAGALHTLALVYETAGRTGEALDVFRRAVEAAPDVPDFHNNFGCALARAGRPADAEARFRAAVRLRPDYAAAHLNLGLALAGQRRTAEAADALREAVRLDPGAAAGHMALGDMLKLMGRPDEAAAAYRRAVAARPDLLPAHRALATTVIEQGRLDEALVCLRRIVELDPGSPAAHSRLLCHLHYDPRQSPRDLYDEAVRWADRHAARHYPTGGAAGYDAFRDHDRDPDRPLRVGYLSTDFCDHPVGRLVHPVLAAHDRAAVQVYCYSDVRRPDGLTGRLWGLADVWRETAGMPDAALADLIRSDRIDVLVETSGHFGDHRLTLFARRPAPVQVSHFGYCGTTGLRTINYRMTDPRSDPPGEADAVHTERLLRLPDTTWCYRPFEPTPDVGPLPARRNGFVTFGCLNNLIKMTDEVVAAWSRVLHAVPGSRLVLLARPAAAPQAAGRFARHGVGPGRLEWLDMMPRSQYLRAFNRLDVALDPFPFNGDNTTCDALWMGVPVVAVRGRSFASRRTYSHLSQVGLGDLAAGDPDAYVAAAAGLAADLDRLSDLRAGLRPRMLASPLCDAGAYTQNLERAYRDVWRRWAAGA